MIQTIRNGISFLMSSPFTCRKVDASSLVREPAISFGRSGCVAMFEVVDGNTVVFGAIRHQREDDYH